MDEWMREFLNVMFTPGFNGRANGKTQVQQDAQDKIRIKRETTREVTTDGRFVRTTTLSLIQEGEFTEIEDAETDEASVGELENQTADRGEEILDHEADEE